MENIDDKKLDNIIEIIKREFEFASNKFGPFHSTHEGYGIIKEEFDEMWDRIKQNSDLCFEECIQVVAMSLRFLYDLSNENILKKAGDRIRGNLCYMKYGKEYLKRLSKEAKEKG